MQKTFSKKLKQIMLEKELTQAELAKLIGLDQSRISKWLTGTRNPSTPNLQKLASALKVSVNELLSDDTSPQETNSNILKLPILTTVMCGKPDYCELDEKVIDDFLEVPNFMFPNSNFIVKCLGTSMLPDIPPQAYCVIKKMDTPLNNKFMLVKTENGFTIKKIVITNGKIQLEYLNPKGKKIIPKELKIIGKFLGIFNKF